MAQVEATIDSIRIADVCPERTLVLKEKGADNYLPIRISPGQTETLAALLQGLPIEMLSWTISWPTTTLPTPILNAP